MVQCYPWCLPDIPILQDFGLPNITFACNHTRENCITDNTVFDLSDLDVLNQAELSAFFVDNLIINERESHVLERGTVLQGESSE